MIRTIPADRTWPNIALISDITYKNEDSWYGETQRPLKLSVLMPKHREECKPMPLLLWLCGGNFQVVDHNIWIPEMVDYARRGFIVASAEYRTVNDVPYPAPLVDVKAAIRYLRAHKERYCIDDRYIFVMGESAGAALACYAGILKDPALDQGDFLEVSSAVSGVIDLYGPVDFRLDFENVREHPAKHGAYLQRTMAFPNEDGSPSEADPLALSHITPDTPPFLILHGTGDEKVPLKQSDDLYATLTEKGVPADYIRIEGAIHGEDSFYQPRIVDLVVEFMNRIVNDLELTGPAPPGLPGPRGPESDKREFHPVKPPSASAAAQAAEIVSR